ncbi:MAG: helix-turn-helix domain-containing protein [Gammaproteobacteria bacterium]|nr:helix-turn-helix domain-containing protein [Gammaproteobacteria bacterium]
MGTSRTDGVYSWDKFMPDEAIADGGNYFNHHQGIVIFKKHQDFIEQLEFASADKNYPAIELCLNKFHLLEKFVFYFKDKAAKLIAKSDKEHLIIPDSMQNKALEEKTYSEFCNLIKTNKIHLNFKSKAIILTKREYEVLLQFAQGKTVKEAAKVLNISPRTVESHLKNAKDKSNCLFKSQIIDILRNSLLSSVRLINSENIG